MLIIYASLALKIRIAVVLRIHHYAIRECVLNAKLIVIAQLLPRLNVLLIIAFLVQQTVTAHALLQHHSVATLQEENVFNVLMIQTARLRQSRNVHRVLVLLAQTLLNANVLLQQNYAAAPQEGHVFNV